MTEETIRALFAPGAPPVGYIRRVTGGVSCVWWSADVAELLPLLTPLAGAQITRTSPEGEPTEHYEITLTPEAVDALVEAWQATQPDEEVAE
jgi:hypothetical protein